MFSPSPSRHLSPTLLALELLPYFLSSSLLPRLPAIILLPFYFPPSSSHPSYYIPFPSIPLSSMMCRVEDPLEIPERCRGWSKLDPTLTPSSDSGSRPLPCTPHLACPTTLTLLPATRRETPQDLALSFHIFYTVSTALLNSGWSFGK